MEGENGPKQRETRHLGHKGVFSSFFMFLLNIMFYCIYRLVSTKWGAAMTSMGPNDASGVMWAISKYFTLFFRVFSY